VRHAADDSLPCVAFVLGPSLRQRQKDGETNEAGDESAPQSNPWQKRIAQTFEWGGAGLA
jgi:hypothetical protein